MSSSMNKGYLAVVIIIIVVLGGLGVYFILNSNQGPRGEILLGATVSLTGGTATEGQRVLNGYKLAVDDINNGGGVMVNGTAYNLHLVYYDDKSDKAQAATLYDQLINQDKVDLLLGPYSSSIVLSVAPVADNAKIPLIQAGGASDSIYTSGYNYVFGLYRVGSTYTQPIFEYLNSSSKISEINSIGAFVETDSFSVSVWNGASNFINHTSISYSNVYKYDHTTGDLNSINTQMSDLESKGGADMILAIGHYADAVQVMEQIQANNLKPKVIFGTVGVPEPSFVSDLGTKAENVTGFAQWVTNLPDSEAPGIADFVTEYNQTYHELPAYHGAGGYAAIQVAKAAIEKAGTFTDHDKVRDALKTLDVKTIWGTVKFAASGVIIGSPYMVQIQNGNIETVFPSAYKTKDVIYPAR